ncbi:MBL fold metallo-hydrolase [Syntrophomonas erecta]
MKKQKISGNTFWIKNPTNTGLFVFKDKYTLLVDCGTIQQAKKIGVYLGQEGLNIKYLFYTHSHPDHCEGNLYCKNQFPGSHTIATEETSLFMENSYLFPLYLYGGNPSTNLLRSLSSNQKQEIDQIITPGTCKINEEKFEVIPLPGHALGQAGIGTRDRVCFLGDALFSQEILEKYSFPFLYDIPAFKSTLELLPQLDYEYFVLGHADQIYSREELVKLTEMNTLNLNRYLDLVVELLQQPKSREELLEEIVILEDLEPDFQEYFFISSTLAAMIAFLDHKNLIDYQLENGRLYYYAKS